MVRGRVGLPPLVETDEAVVVHVDFFKEPREAPLGHRKPGLLEGHAQLIPAYFSIVIVVDGLEEAEQLALGSLDEDTKLCTAASQGQRLLNSQVPGRWTLPSYCILPSRLVSTSLTTSPSRSSAFFRAVLAR